MKTEQIIKSEELVRKTLVELLEMISEHVSLLAMHDEPIEQLMEVKRALYQIKGQFYKKQAETNVNMPQDTETESGAAGSRILWLVEELDKKLGVDIQDSVRIGMVGEDDLKRVLIRHEYIEMAKQGFKYKDVKQVLSWKYDWSVSRIEKLVYRYKRR